MKENILLLNGSTRIKGNSLHICESLSQIFTNKGVKVEIESIQEHFNKKDIEKLEEHFRKADVIGLVAPLYVDAFPYPVIAFLEEIHERFGEILKCKSLFMIGQCNFPESRRVTPMILSCECFAKEVDMKFLGAMAYGGSVVRLEGRTLEETGKEGERMIKAMDMMADEILSNKEISEKSKDLFKNDIPKFIHRPFTVIANIMLKQSRKKYMTHNNN